MRQTARIVRHKIQCLGKTSSQFCVCKWYHRRELEENGFNRRGTKENSLGLLPPCLCGSFLQSSQKLFTCKQKYVKLKLNKKRNNIRKKGR